ncbi:glycine betaine ABC transporter substrate-binding protein [Chengkuizengella axinellae]|uniref:Glycine betaine ABC transporter substrate-binding protein n=1 Tax=Chengkuizengella axinellae TaxID=3064388 RepID=A0ABT9J3U4_9BACL|nr:glycine betaine ABC transporter substrate-binding protein [Chengkuizengella sp. 2205SS18-9]MDP5276292.1 glycine betaine ABC transporter substrate-binding protein [Chengkuizengella sp. 2205SS18-9]
MFKKMSVLSLMLVLALVVSACAQSNEESGEGAGTDSESVGESVNYQIIGIDPGAGLMKATADVIDQYELEDWKLVEGSSAAMAAALKKAYDKKEPIIVTSWTPHWMFSKFDLKYLEDPLGIYGEDENIHTIVRNGLAEDLPTAYQVLDQFDWTSDDMANVMVSIQEGTSPEDAAEQWVSENADLVEAWTDGAESVDGDDISIAYVAWDSEIAFRNF